MSKRIFLSIFIVAVLVLVSGISIVSEVVYSHFSAQYLDTLVTTATLLADAVEKGAPGYLEDVEYPHRMTLIDADGWVLYDNTKEVNMLENHGQREEILQASSEGIGISERYSDTLAEKSVNVAIKLEDGRFLRVSVTQHTILKQVYFILVPFLLIFTAAVIVSAILASRLAKKIVKPINEINLESPSESDVYPELKPLVQRIIVQNHEISQRIDEIKETHEKHEQIYRDFLTNASHELKTPLTSIIGYSEIIGNGTVKKEEDVQRFARTICHEANRLSDLVSDIIFLSELDEISLINERTPTDLLDCCIEISERLKSSAASRNISISVEGEHAIINGISRIIEEIVSNLTDNAIKYNHDNGKVTININNTVSGALLSVTDTGIGIPEEHIERVFERFYRVDKSHSRKLGGTGLGLSIVSNGCRLHSAEIYVDSKVGAGTTVSVLFPKNI